MVEPREVLFDVTPNFLPAIASTTNTKTKTTHATVEKVMLFETLASVGKTPLLNHGGLIFVMAWLMLVSLACALEIAMRDAAIAMMPSDINPSLNARCTVALGTISTWLRSTHRPFVENRA